MIDYSEIMSAVRKSLEPFSSKKLIIAGNWKMNMTISEGNNFLQALGDIPRTSRVIIFPPYTTLSVLANEFRRRNIRYGPQNFHWREQGAYTGDISVAMLQEIECGYALVGHSERRSACHETDVEINHKVLAGTRAGINVMLCIGEDLEQRRNEGWKELLKSQIEIGLEGVDTGRRPQIYLAYEPVWAIGTGVSADSEQICETHRWIKEVSCRVLGSEVPVLYGGSVNDKNVLEIGMITGVDGFLIGGASLKADIFLKIIQLAG